MAWDYIFYLLIYLCIIKAPSKLDAQNSRDDKSASLVQTYSLDKKEYASITLAVQATRSHSNSITKKTSDPKSFRNLHL